MEEQAPMNIDILKEMIRLAEKRREEEWDAVERANKYNLALIGFSGSFLSVLITTQLAIEIVTTAGLFLLSSIITSLFALRPRTIKASITIDEDIAQLRNGEKLSYDEYLLDVADITDRAATRLSVLAGVKKRLTIASALSLAGSLILTYILYVHATTR